MEAFEFLRITVSKTRHARGYAVPAIEDACRFLRNYTAEAELCYRGVYLMAFIAKESAGKPYRPVLEEAMKAAYSVCVLVASQHRSHAKLCKEACTCISNAMCVQEAVAAGVVDMACDVMLEHTDTYSNQKHAAKILDKILRQTQSDQRDRILQDLTERDIPQKLEAAIQRFPQERLTEVKKLLEHFSPPEPPLLAESEGS